MTLLLGLILCVSAALAAPAGAEVQTVEFDEGPLGSPLEGFGKISFPRELGFRPYRTNVGARAKSEPAVGNIGRCIDESAEPSGCEQFQAHTTARLAETAERVTVFAGEFGPFDPTAAPERATLTAFRANGSEVGHQGPVPIDDLDFKTPLTVASPNGDIASFTVAATTRTPDGGESPNAGDLGIDDVTVAFASGKPADFSISTTTAVVPVIQGQQVEVPLHISRINGSSGEIHVSVSGLPIGVDAVVPQISGTQTTAMLTLIADTSAPAHLIPDELTITATPENGNVGPAPRTTRLSLRVATNFELISGDLSDTNLPPQGGGKVPIEVPDCAPVDVPLKVERDIAFNQDVALSLREDEFGAVGLPAGVSGEILPSSIVPPGGNLVAERTLRFRAGPDAELTGIHHLPILLEGKTGDGALNNTRVLPMSMVRAEPSATIATTTSGSGVGFTPRFGKEGSRVTIHGNGFCPGTFVEVGNERATVPTTLVNDHTLEFTVPRYATSGTVRIDPPGRLGPYRTSDSLAVDSIRNSDGFKFKNYGFHSLSLGELTEAFGADELFVTVNPCWPFGQCRVVTGILNPFVAVEWGALNLALRSTNGHCLGMALASQRLANGEDSLRRFTTSGGQFAHPQVFDIPSEIGPSAYTDSYLTALHARQASNEFIKGWLTRDRSIQDQIDLIAREFSHNREPIVGVFGENGHAVLAYDMVQTPNTADLYVYDNNEPFTVGEELNGPEHQKAVDSGVIHIDKVKQTWSYPAFNSKGGNGGTLWAFPQGMIPSDPSLPGLGDVTVGSFVLSSFLGGVETTSSANAEYLPAQGGSATAPGSSGTWVTRNSHRPLAVTVKGKKAGHYSQTYTAAGFIASANDVATDKGVRDTVRGANESLTLASGEDRPLQIELARQASSRAPATIAATLDTHASAGGSDTAGFSDARALTYAHDGAPTAIRFSLTSVRRNGGPSTFASGPVAVGRGDHLSVKPLDRDLSRVRVTIRHANGRTTRRVLRNRGRAPGHLKLGAPRISGHHLSLRFRLSGVHGRAIVGATLRLVRGKHVLAHKALSLKASNGARKLTWRLPRGAKRGRYRLLVDLRAITIASRGSTTTASVSAHRSATVKVGR